MSTGAVTQASETRTLLYNDECSVFRRIARWVKASQRSERSRAALRVIPIGDDPLALRALHPDLDIWDAYATIHLLMPDGAVRRGGEAVAEVLRVLPNTQWFAWTFALGAFGFRPFQATLNLAYTVLAALRPLFGCESCGVPGRWVRPVVGLTHHLHTLFGGKRHPPAGAHFASLSPRAHRVAPAASH